QHAARMELRADEHRQTLRARRAAEGCSERDGLHDATSAAHFLAEVARDDPAEAVTDAVDARARGDRIDDRGELRGDPAKARERHAGKARRLHAQFVFEADTKRPESSGRREEAVNQHDHVLARRDRRNARSEIANVDDPKARNGLSEHPGALRMQVPCYRW